MSWSIDLTGKPAAVAKALAARTLHKCAEPEETVRQHALAALNAALAVFPDHTPIKLAASGSQSGPDPDGKYTNSLSVKLETIYGFLE